MTIMKNDRLFPNFDIQVGSEKKKLVGVKLYTGIDTIQGVFAWLIGKAGRCTIDGKKEFYNINSMKKFIHDNRLVANDKPLNQETVNFLIKTVISEFKNQKEGTLLKAESIRSKMDVHLYRSIGLEKSDTVSMSIASFKKDLLDTLNSFGLQLNTSISSDGGMVLEGIPLPIVKKDGVETVQLSREGLIRACVKFLIEMGDYSKVADKISAAPLDEIPEEIKLFLQKVISLARRQPELVEQKKKIQEIGSPSQEIGGLTILDLDETTVKNEEELATISHKALEPYENSVVLRSQQKDTIINIFTNKDSLLERTALFPTHKTISQESIIYLLNLKACSDAFSSMGMPEELHNKLGDFDKKDGASSPAESMLQFTRKDVEAFRQYIRSSQKIEDQVFEIGQKFSSDIEPRSVENENQKSVQIEESTPPKVIMIDQAIIKTGADASHLKNLQANKTLNDAEKRQIDLVIQESRVPVSDQELQLLFYYMQEKKEDRTSDQFVQAVDRFIGEKLQLQQQIRLLEIAFVVDGQVEDTKRCQHYFQNKIDYKVSLKNEYFTLKLTKDQQDWLSIKP
ncbi:MAG: hypothetical protein QRY74_00540 [Chlamydia sp.]